MITTVASLLLLMSGGLWELRGKQPLSLSVFFCAVFLLLMTYSFAPLLSACLENNEGVCCINLCNGEREEGWDGGAVKGGGDDELMLVHCSSCIHALHLVFMTCAHSYTWCTNAYAKFLCNSHRNDVCTCRRGLRESISWLSNQNTV